jgi:NADH:ubiquinone oxidoreductase subunit 6 (subunit J)
MLALAKALVDWNALGKIILVGLVGGVGVVIVFGLAVYGVERFEAAKTVAGKAINAVLVGAAGAFCIGAVVVGIIAMANPSHGSTTKKTEKKAAVSAQRAE